MYVPLVMAYFAKVQGGAREVSQEIDFISPLLLSDLCLYHLESPQNMSWGFRASKGCGTV
jgi:hypothetical protein